MKKILITGANSYVGTSFDNYMKQWPEKYLVDTLDMVSGNWRNFDFSEYDVVYHVAGIAHSDTGNVSEEQKAYYYKINTNLTVETAKKAKEEGVRQFIFMSSAIVYGNSAPIGKKKRITKDTPVNPANFYGNSKVQAENAILLLNDESFRVVVLRPPMIYGKRSKGNYPTLAKMALKLPLFPKVNNERSMLYIGNLVEFVRLMVENEEFGIFWPQNSEYSNTSELTKMIASSHDKKIYLIPGMDWLLKILSYTTGLIDKAFGSLTYDKIMSEYKYDYRKYSLIESIFETEGVSVSSTKKQVNPNGKPKALMLASVASMIDLFNEDNIKLLLDLGYDIDVAANFENGSITSQDRVDKYKQELTSREINVFHVPIPRSISKIKNIIESYKIVKNIVIDNRYEIVHCHSPIGGVICRLACRRARKIGTKVIYTAHGFHFFEGASKTAWMIFYPIEMFLSRFTDVLITINQEDYKRGQKFHAKKVEYIPGIGVHTKAFRETVVDKKLKRRELGIGDDDFVFMSTGQVSVRKNHEVIIRALSKIDNPKIKYLIVGFGELEEKLKELVNELRIENRVVFAGYRGDIKELLSVVDAFAFPSLQEGLPVALMEAMSVGLPVVCSKIRGNVDLIENGKGGYVYNINDVDGFAEGMKKIVESYQHTSNLREVNLETMKKFDINEVNREMKRIYTNI